MITVSKLSFSYTAQSKISFPGFTVSKNEHCLLLGESGSGKTTLLHLLGGLLRGYTGSLQIDNTELSTLSESGLDKFRGKHIGFIFQKNHLISALSVEKNVILSPYLAGIEINKQHAQEVLSELGLAEKSNSSVKQISQGQAQRVAIARAVMNQPSIILADEPTSALDDKSCDRVITLLLDVATRNNAILVVATHDQRLKDKIKKQVIL